MEVKIVGGTGLGMSPVSGDGPFMVGLRNYKMIGWLCMLFFLGCSVAVCIAGQPGQSAILGGFALLGMYIVMSVGTIELDKDGISDRSPTGHYRMFWRDVRHIEVGVLGTMVLHGDGKRFVLSPASYWSGSDKHEALAFFDRKTTELAITMYLSRVAEYKFHKNVKVRGAAQ